MAPVRGGIYTYRGALRPIRQLVVSIDALNRSGTALVAEVADGPAHEDLRALLAVRLGSDDPAPGAWVLCWRLNFVHAERLDVDSGVGRVTAQAMEQVVRGIRAAVEP